jgi:hypothetical protein
MTPAVAQREEPHDLYLWPRVDSFRTEEILREHPELKIARRVFAERRDNPHCYDPQSVLIMARHVGQGSLPVGSAGLIFAAREIIEQEAKWQSDT